MTGDLTLDDLVAPFYSARTPRAQFRIGAEAEKFGLLGDTLAPLPFEGERSVRAVFERLAADHGWSEVREYTDGPTIALHRADASITLEPAGQLELSGSPLSSVHEACAEFADHLRELREVSEPLGIEWLSLGFHPFATHEQLPEVPKLRYGIMQRYLPTRGRRALDMMRRTCTVQANLDYEDEADAVRKLRVALALQPIVTAMFANSPLYEGLLSGRRSERAAVWLEMDPDRSGLMPFAWERDMSFRRYVEWALDVPMFLVKRGDRLIENTGQTFRQFMAEGRGGTTATAADWETHLNSLFPEARLKRTLEVRGADAQPSSLVCAIPALWKGLLYDERALALAESLVAPLSAEIVERVRPDIASHALAAELLDRPLSRWAQEVVEIAEGGLSRLAVRNANGDDERVHLQRLRGLLEQGLTPADALIERLSGASDPSAIVLEQCRV